jgi:hypothetical protein
MSPYDSDDLTEIIVRSGKGFLLLRSPHDAETSPEYRRVAGFSTREQALARLLNPDG